MIKNKIKTTTLITLSILVFTGCSWIFGGASSTIRAFYRYAEKDDPEAMNKLFSSSYLAKNKKSLEYNKSFADLVQKSLINGEKLEITEISEKYVGEKAIVDWRYGSQKGGRIKFQARLVKENGEWKIEVIGSGTEDLSKEEPVIERSNEFVREIETDGKATLLTFSPDAKTLAFAVSLNEDGKKNNYIQLIDVQTGNVKDKIGVKAEFDIGNLKYSSDGKMLAATDRNKLIYVWDIDNPSVPKQTITFNESNKYENAVAISFSNDGLLYIGGLYGSLLVFDPKTGDLKQKLEGHPTDTKNSEPAVESSEPPPPSSGLLISDIVFSTDGKFFATIAQNQIKIWDVKNGKALKKLILPAEIVNGVTKSNVISAAFSTDNKTLLTYSNNGKLQHWSIQTGESSMSKNLEKLDVGFGEFSPSGKFLSDNGGNNNEPPRGVKIYDAQTGEVKATFTGHRGQPKTIFSNDDKLAASVSDNDYNKIFIWNISGLSN